MNTRIITGLFVIVSLLCQFKLHAQTFAIPFTLTQSSPSLTFSLDGNGVLLSTGTENGTAVLTSGEEGAGARLLWYPGKAAFRAGAVTGTNWDDSNIGNYSMALGNNSEASGINSFAAGLNASATGGGSIAIGSAATAEGGSRAWNFAIGTSALASAPGACAMGFFATASGSSAVAIGNGGTLASGNASLAMGFATASGTQSVAIGGGSVVASGNFSFASGLATQATSYGSFVSGAYNTGLSASGSTPSLSTWLGADPLFEIGNGTYGNPSDALVVYKNGNAKLQGALDVLPGGDLSMGSFTAGTAP